MNDLTMEMKPGQLCRGPSGKPAIQWWRYGIAREGESSIVTQVREYEDEQSQLNAIFDNGEKNE
jgi:hypothetical protein